MPRLTEEEFNARVGQLSPTESLQLTPQQEQARQQQPAPESSAADAFISSFERNNVITSGIKWFSEQQIRSDYLDQSADEDYNPRDHFPREMWPIVDGAVNGSHAQHLIANTEINKNLARIRDEHSVAAALGVAAGVLTDPTSYLGSGGLVGVKGMLRFGVEQTALNAAQEGVLYATQADRTASESLANVAFSVPVIAGLGVLTTPLRRAASDTAASAAASAASRTAATQATDGSLGAAATRELDTSDAYYTIGGKVYRGLANAGRWLTQGTLDSAMGTVMRSASPVARKFGIEHFQWGRTIADNYQGRAAAISTEAALSREFNAFRNKYSTRIMKHMEDFEKSASSLPAEEICWRRPKTDHLTGCLPIEN